MTRASIDAPQALRSVKHLLVDLDGTLLNNNALALQFDFVRRVLSALKAAGKTSTIENIKTLLKVNQALRGPGKDQRTHDLQTLEIIGSRFAMGVEDARVFVRSTLMDVFPKLEKHFYPRPGAHEFLEWARVRYPMTLATNPVWPAPIIEMRVRWAGVDPTWFQWMTTVNDMRAAKPHLDYYQGILERLHLKPQECLMIGDTASLDLPAVAAGIPVFLLRDRPGLASITFKNAHAPAWKGSYADLRKLLEASLAQ